MSSNEKDGRQLKAIYTAVVLLLFIAGYTQIGTAQQIATKSEARESQMEDPHRLPGKLLVKGSNTTPTGTLGLLTYQLEEVSLPAPVEYYSRSQKKQSQQLIRLNITGELLGGDYVIWINDKAVKNIAHMGLKQISALIADPSILEDGAVLAVAPASREYERSTLPERLELPYSLKAATPSSPTIEAGIGIALRSTSLIMKDGPQPYVEIIARSEFRKFPVMNSSLYLHIGQYEFRGGMSSDETTAIFRLTGKEFSQLKDGDLMVVTYSEGVPDWSNGGGPLFWDFGPINKSKLDK